MVARLVGAMAQAGIRIDPAWIVNCYVALKSKPLTILAGTERSGKVLLVKNLTQLLVQDIWRNQAMLGHAWWAEQTGNVALFTEAQTRLNSGKILALIEEASLPENADRMFIARLNRISRAELAGLFSEMAFQLQHKRLMCLPSYHLTKPVLCPPNFALLGTMDTAQFDWRDEDLFSQTTVIPWLPAEVRALANHFPAGPIIPGAERLFLRSCIRNEEAAFHKLHRIQGWRQLIWPLYVIEDLLSQHQVVLPEGVIGEAMIYVANAWSVDGEGLFDPVPARNLTTALDFAIIQSLLLRACGTIRDSAALRTRLAGALSGRFSHSATFLQNVQDAETKETNVQPSQTPEKPAQVGLPTAPLVTKKAPLTVGDPAFSFFK